MFVSPFSHNLTLVPNFSSVQFSSVAQSCPTLWDPMHCSMPGLPVHHQLPEFIQTHVHWVGDATQPFHLCHPLLLPPSVFPSIRVFSSEPVLLIRWPKYWSYSFWSPNISYIYLYSYTKHNYYTSNTTADYLLKLSISLHLFVSMLRIILHSYGQTFLNLFVGDSNDMIKDK